MINKINKDGMINAIDWVLFKTASLPSAPEGVSKTASLPSAPEGVSKTASLTSAPEGTQEKEITNKIYYCKPFLAFANCTQKGNVDSDIQFDKVGLGFNGIEEILLQEINYWGQKGIKNIKSLCENIPEDSESLLVYRESLSSINEKSAPVGVSETASLPLAPVGVLKTISILKNNDATRNELLLYPLYWYECGELLFTIPEPMITDKILSDRTFFNSYICEKCTY